MCKKEKESPAKSELSLRHVAGIFYILISGLILAMISAVAEYFYKSYRLHKTEKVTLFECKVTRDCS